MKEVEKYEVCLTLLSIINITVCAVIGSYAVGGINTTEMILDCFCQMKAKHDTVNADITLVRIKQK